MRIAIRGIGLITALGQGAQAHLDARGPNFRPLGEHPAASDPKFDHLPAAWIEERDFLNSRKFGPATCLGVEVVKQAIADSGLSSEEIRDAHLWVGTSRGNAAAFVDPWPGRRPAKLLAASNSLHGEVAAAISIDQGIQGPYNVLANGCSASLDALGWAYESIRSGRTRTAIAVGVELPISPSLLRDYHHAGMLSSNGTSDPYSPQASGFIPSEAGAAIVLQAIDDDDENVPCLNRYDANSDATTLLGVPRDGAPLSRLLEQIQSPISVICPHASGTPLHAIGEIAGIRSAFAKQIPELLPLKPWLGHSIGASGAVESALIAAWLRSGSLPGAREGIAPKNFQLHSGGPIKGEVLKIASSMGGHNAIIGITG